MKGQIFDATIAIVLLIISITFGMYWIPIDEAEDVLFSLEQSF